MGNRMLMLRMIIRLKRFFQQFPFALSVLHETVVGDDRVEPCAEFCLSVKGPQLPEDVDESILERFCGLLGIAADLVRKTVHRVFVAPDELGERCIIAVAGDTNEFVVREVSRRPGAQ